MRGGDYNGVLSGIIADENQGRLNLSLILKVCPWAAILNLLDDSSRMALSMVRLGFIVRADLGGRLTRTREWCEVAWIRFTALLTEKVLNLTFNSGGGTRLRRYMRIVQLILIL